MGVRRNSLLRSSTINFVIFALILVSSAQQPPYSCGPETSSLYFCKAKLPIHKRARDLVSRLTLDEKISQLVNSAPAIPRLGVPQYEWWSEALHGVANVGKGIALNGPIRAATSFPQVILTAASFDSKLWYRIGQVSPLSQSESFPPSTSISRHLVLFQVMRILKTVPGNVVDVVGEVALPDHKTW